MANIRRVEPKPAYSPSGGQMPTVNPQIFSQHSVPRRAVSSSKQAMTEIESSVTKLLIATKQLLECLTQWARLQATEKDVSDIYVNLGNEFNRATLSFQQAGIDMTDLEKTPHDLRQILERTLGEDASIAVLERFLPRIREIIINLLQGLKRKQQIHRMQNGEAAAPARLHRQVGPPLQGPSRQSEDRQASISSTTSSAKSDKSPSISAGQLSAKSSITKKELPPAPHVSPSQIHAPRKAPEPPSTLREHSRDKSLDPVTRLSQMNLERRSSKRFSENYLAQLTSSPNGERNKPSVDNVRKHIKPAVIPEAVEPQDSKPSSSPQALRESPSIPSPTPRNSSLTNGRISMDALQAATTTCFVKYGEQVKKLTFEGEVTMTSIQDTVKRIFSLTSVVLYLEDPTAKIFYELEDVKDLKQRSMLTIHTQKEKPLDREPSSDSDLKAWIDAKFESLRKDFAYLQEKIVLPVPENITSSAHDELKKQLEKQRVVEEELRAKIETLEARPPSVVMDTPIVVSANRDHVMSLAAKHEQGGTELTSKLEDAMNAMDRIKKDVLTRKVSPRPQQLTDLHLEFEAIQAQATALEENLLVLDEASNKLWEQELTIITAEQDAIEFQRAFIEDIKADLKDSLGNLDTIRKVEEQKRLAPPSGPVVLDTAGDPSKAIKFVQADIKSLDVNHEKRAAAIADAEKLRARDREYLLENEFKNELGAFVESSALKSTGGALEVERQRQEKDEAHRKLLFSPPETPSEDLADPLIRSTTPVNKGSAAGGAAAAVLARINASGSPIPIDVRRTSVSPRRKVDVDVPQIHSPSDSE